MTRQIPDRIELDSGPYTLYPCLPLLPEADPLWERCRFGPGDSTANQRGYTARWAIRDGRLLLLGCGGSVRADGDFGRPSRSDEPRPRIGMRDIHGVDTPIPATWISGDLTCPSSQSLDRAFGDFVPEHFRLFRLERGAVVADLTVPNAERLEDTYFYRTGALLDEAVARAGDTAPRRVADPAPVRGLAEALQTRVGADAHRQRAALLWQAGPADVEVLASALEGVVEAGVRTGIACALGRIGPEAAPAIPGLMRVLRAADDPATVRALAFALGGIGLPAAPTLPIMIPLVEARCAGLADSQIRLLLDTLEPVAEHAMDLLLAGLLASRSAGTRDRIATLLARVGVAAVLPLSRAFVAADGDAAQRAYLARALGRVGRGAGPALGLLLDGLEPLQDDWVREAFAEAIASIGLRSPASLAPLRAAFRSARDAWALGRLADAIASLGPAAVATLVEEFEAAASEPARTEIARALGCIGPAAGPAVECLAAAAATSADADLVKAVAEALRMIGAPADRLATARIAALRHRPHDAWAEGILRALQSGVLPSEGAVWDLVGLLVEAGESTSGRLMAKALGAMGAIAVEPLLLALRHVQDGQRRLLIIHALSLIGPPAAAAIDVVVAALDAAGTDPLRLQLVDDLRRLGRPDLRHMDTLVAVLNRSAFTPVRWRLGLVIAEFGPPAVGPLIGILERTQDDDLRRAIGNALSEIGTTAISAAPSLLVAMRAATDPRTRRTLADALRKTAVRSAVSSDGHVAEK